MSTHQTVQPSSDEQCYLSQDCPGCERRLKVKFSASDQPISFFPYCGHIDMGCWWTPEQAEYLSAKAAEEVVGLKLEKMARDFNRKSSDSLTSMNMRVSRSPTPPARKEPKDVRPVVTFEYCGGRRKYDGQNSDLRCISCGTPTVALSNGEGQA